MRFIVLQMLMPPVTLVMARNRMSEMTAIETDAVLILALSWRSVNMLSPLQYTEPARRTSDSRKPESA